MQLLTFKQTADYLQFHPAKLYRLIKQKLVPALKLGGQWRFSKEVLDDWIDGKLNQ